MESRILSADWRFTLEDVPQAWQKGFDDAAWRVVSLPHDWAVEHPFSTQYSSGTGYLPGGVGWYRQGFTLEEGERGKRVELLFDGVYNHSSVWVNGYFLGGRPNGYVPFRFDVTDAVCFGEAGNVISVRVDHSDPADSRWFTGSGITRKVTLILRDPVHVAPDGVFVVTESADAREALLRVHTRVENGLGATLRQTLYYQDGDEHDEHEDKNGKIAAETCVRIQSPDTSQTLCVERPHLWSVESPYLYRLVTTVEMDGVARDAVSTPIGLRVFQFDPEKGFVLNGEPLKLKGVCVHHDAGCLGAAVRAPVWRRRLLALKALGVNALRMSHNPHMPELYDLCDEMGLLVMDEAFDEWEGFKNKWRTGHNVAPPHHAGYAADFPEWHARDVVAMVLRDRNHPCVILWSIGNEIDYPNDPYAHPRFSEMIGNNDANKPDREFVYDPSRPNAERIVPIARALYALVKAADPTRPVTAALAFPELSTLTGFADELDVVGYNYKEHLFREDHARFPNRPLLASEASRETAAWRVVRENDFVAGQFLWTGIDFLGETHGWPSRGSNAGLLDLAGFRKPIAYHRAALWLDQPVVKLFARHAPEESETGSDAWRRSPIHATDLVDAWAFPEGASIEAVVMTNAAAVELFLNGVRVGFQASEEASEGVLLFRLTAAPGVLVARATMTDGAVVEDSLGDVGMPAGITLTADRTSLIADGRALMHIVAEITDANRRRVPNAENMLHVDVTGGVLLGLENGNQEDTQAYTLPYRRAHRGRLLLYIGAPTERGEIRVKVSSDTLGSAEWCGLAE
ncbi:MAG: DUF4982 domain-containing protein [Oscillospiraceae bacterium]|jgi:hypothetical protein|nr:DUF4982 domain-containing protein [Oscillospiraceae bacterium]